MKEKILFIIICMLLIPSLTHAKQSALIGKRYVSFSYGLGSNEIVESSVYSSYLNINIPVSRRLDLGFGTNQSWTEYKLNDNNQVFREFLFYTNLIYHFLPNSVINPYIVLEMGQSIGKIESENSEEALQLSSLNLGGEELFNNSYNILNVYYGAGIGEEFLINDKTSFSLLFKYGKIGESVYQSLTTGIGYWILQQFFLETKAQFNFNNKISMFSLVGNIEF